MKRDKAIDFKQTIIFLIVFVVAVFPVKKGNKQNAFIEQQEEIQEVEWQVKEDDEAAIGSNLFYGSSIAEGNNSIYALDLGRYGGKPVSEDECYNIYQMKEGEWELFISKFPYGMNDDNSITNLVYFDGYIYFVLKEVHKDVGKTEEESYIFKVSEEDGNYGSHRPTEFLLSCDKNFYIYEREIYIKFQKNGTRYFYKANLNGEDKEVLYSDEQEDSSDYDYAIGGGCLYIKDRNQILGINLETGERKSFETDAEHIEGMFYEKGKLYIYDSENGEVWQIDVRTGDESKLIEGKILMDCVWLNDGYLYYVEGEEKQEGFHCKLKALNVMTGKVILWEYVLFDKQPCSAGLEVVGNRVMASFCEKEDEAGEYKYFEKEISEIANAEDKPIWEMLCQGKDEVEEKTIVVQKGSQEDDWQIEQDDEAAIGYNLTYSAISAEGNGCIYSTGIEKYGGKLTGEDGEDNYANIYRLKDGKWELFVSNPATEEDPWYAEISVYNLAYLNGYLYYILLRDYEPSSGSAGKHYSICRVSELGGDVEELAKCNGNFFIYQGKIFYQTYINGVRCYFKMKSDGSDKERIYFDHPESKSYSEYSDYAVGGGCLYLQDGEKILVINLKTGMRKKFETGIKHIEGMFYEAGKLYIHDCDSIILQLDVITGNEIKIIDGINSWTCAEWIHEGYMYYLEWKVKVGEILYYFKSMNLMTGESLVWDSISLETHPSGYFLEVVNDQVIINLAFKNKDEMGNEVYEERYFKKEISEITENSKPELSDEELEQIKSEADSFLSASVLSDFLAMDSEDFEDKYDRNQLYERNILYCDMAAWRFHGYYGMTHDWEDCYDYSNIINITALRYIVDGSLYDFVEANHADMDSVVDSDSTTDVYIQHVGDYAMSICFQRDTNTQKEDSVKLLEISFVKVELREGAGTAPKPLYQLLEDNYYDGMESILASSGGLWGWPEDWIISPDGNKEVCVLNGMIPNSPAQIFIRYRDKRPDTVLWFTWEQGIAGWIDEEHVVYYRMDMNPYLIHLETNQVEEVEIAVGEDGRSVFDAYCAHYEINGNKLVAEVLGEEIYHWNIVKENNEVYIMEEN